MKFDLTEIFLLLACLFLWIDNTRLRNGIKEIADNLKDIENIINKKKTDV